MRNFKSGIRQLKTNSREAIVALTDMAKHADPCDIVQILFENSQRNILMLYVIDCIMKTLGYSYIKIFSGNIVSMYTTIFEKADSETREKLNTLRHTWRGVLSEKILSEIDNTVHQIKESTVPLVNKSFECVDLTDSFDRRGDTSVELFDISSDDNEYRGKS